MTRGVGFIGAGAVVQSIHLPTLAALPDHWHIAAVMDVDESAARSVAARAGARATTSLDDLLRDESVAAVAVCSPAELHADHVAAALAAGKAVLCEKPFVASVDDADRVERALAESDAPVVVGAMHAFDPIWQQVADKFAPDAGITLIRSTILLPPNSHFEDFATEITGRDPDGDAEFLALTEPEEPVAECLLGLAVHDLPLIRRAVPMIDAVDSAVALAPYGYAIAYRGGGTTVQLRALFHAHPTAEWTLERWTDRDGVTLTFTPSYVQAGSATATITDADGSRTLGPRATNGYLAEWAHLADLCEAGVQDAAERASMVADIRYTLALGAGAAGVAAAAGVSAATEEKV